MQRRQHAGARDGELAGSSPGADDEAPAGCGLDGNVTGSVTRRRCSGEAAELLGKGGGSCGRSKSWEREDRKPWLSWESGESSMQRLQTGEVGGRLSRVVRKEQDGDSAARGLGRYSGWLVSGAQGLREGSREELLSCSGGEDTEGGEGDARLEVAAASESSWRCSAR